MDAYRSAWFYNVRNALLTLSHVDLSRSMARLLLSDLINVNALGALEQATITQLHHFIGPLVKKQMAFCVRKQGNEHN